MTPERMTDAKHAADYAAVAVGGASLLEFIPAAVGGLTVVWLLIRIWESPTVRRWTGRAKDDD